MLHGCSKIRMLEPRYTDFTESTELFRHFAENTVLSVLSVYEKRILPGSLEKTMQKIPVDRKQDAGMKVDCREFTLYLMARTRI